jgi:DNA-binding CsgD family transcriptional regulator/PAS domain-containing protein
MAQLLPAQLLQVSTPGCSDAIQRDRSRSSSLFGMNSMFDPEQVSSLIGDIYDAVVDQALWVGALEKAAQFVGAQAAVLLWQNPVSISVELIHAFGIEPHYVDLYVERYAKLDPTTTPMFLLETEDVASPTDLLLHGELANSFFYKEWLQPQGFVDLLQASLGNSPTDFVRLWFLRKSESGMVDSSMRERLRLIAPHMRRAVVVSQLVGRAAAEAATFGNALDGIGAGLFFVDASGRIVHANTSGHDMLAQGVLARASGGKLASNDAVQAFDEIFGIADSSDADVGPRGGAVALTASDGDHYVAHVLPLTAGARRQVGAGFEAIAAVFVKKAALDMPSPQDIIAKFYKLTPTELRVLFAIVQVGGVPEVAESMGISPSTVKTHLRRLFVKTGTDRQADLVKLVAGYVNPLVT